MDRKSETFGNFLKRNKLKTFIVLVVIVLLIVATVLITKVILISNCERKNIPINNSTVPSIDTNGFSNDSGKCSNNGTLCLIGRDSWQAYPQKHPLDIQKLPLHRVIISHTATEPCDSIKTCAKTIRVLQEFQMNALGWDDIAFNFLISSDGSVYVGRGWDAIGAHTRGYNTDSVGIAFIGTYVKTAPSEAQIKACLALLEEGVRLKKLAPNYHVYGSKQFAATESPGETLYGVIKKWQQWSNEI